MGPPADPRHDDARDPGTGSRVRAAAAEFLGSSHARPFLDDRAGAGEVARAFLAACHERLGVRADLLDEDQLREAVLEVLPPLLDPAAGASKRAVAIVKALLDHQLETASNPSGWRLGAVLDEIEPEFARRLARSGGREVRPDREPLRRPGSKLGRNDPCPCGSGKKHKKCCGRGS